MRRELDFYETPPHYIAALLSEVSIHGHVYEPCVGEGAIADALRALPAVRRVYTNDIDKKRKADTHYDSTIELPVINFDWAVTNPPFSDELEIIEMTQPNVHNMAFLARLSFLEPTEDREYFLDSNRPTQIIVLPRYSFRLNDEGKRQTDNVTCAWLVWHADKQNRGISFWSRARAQAAAILQGLAE